MRHFDVLSVCACAGVVKRFACAAERFGFNFNFEMGQLRFSAEAGGVEVDGCQHVRDWSFWRAPITGLEIMRNPGSRRIDLWKMKCVGGAVTGTGLRLSL